MQIVVFSVIDVWKSERERSVIMSSSDKYRFVSFCHSMDCVNVLDCGLFVKNCGIERNASGMKWGPSVIKGYHIFIVLAGRGQLCLNDQKRQISAGTVFVLFDGMEMEYRPDNGASWQYAWVTLGGKNVLSHLKEAGFFRNPVRQCSCSLDDFVEILDNMLSSAEPSLSNELRRNSYLYELLSLLVEPEQPQKESSFNIPQDVYVQNAVQYIHRNYSHIKVNDIASHIGINRSYLTTIFKNKLSVSPQEYLVSYRLNKARQLLQTTDLCIQEIAFRVGYDNPLTFSKMFKNTFGMSPKNYRKEICREAGETAGVYAVGSER